MDVQRGPGKGQREKVDRGWAGYFWIGKLKTSSPRRKCCYTTSSGEFATRDI